MMMMALVLRLFELRPSLLRSLTAMITTAMFALECLGLLTGRLLELSKAQR